MQMPVPDASVLDRKARIVERLLAVLPADAVIHDPAETRAYECDGLTAYRCPPLAAVLPRSTAEVSAVLRICHEEGVPVVPRGSGTSLAGGALPTADSVILGVARMNAVHRDGLRQPFHPGAVGADEPERDGGGRERRLLLCARSVQPAGLRHRRATSR